MTTAGGPEKRLLLVVAAYFPDSYGGAERQAKILAEALGRLGIDVTLVTPSIDAATQAIEETSFGRVERIHVPQYPNYGGRHLLSFVQWTYKFLNRYTQPCFAGVPIYVFHARLHALAPALAARRLHSPLLLKLGGGGESLDFFALEQKRYIYGKMVKRLLLRTVDIFVANSAQIEEDLRRLRVAPSRIISFPNGVELPSQAQIHESFETRTGGRFIYTGRLVADKNVDTLYRAVENLLALENFAFQFVGDGPELKRLKQLAASTNRSERISFSGGVDDVYPHLLASDFFVSASLREGQSNSLLEAMSAGCIPIVFAASGVEDVVTDGENGFIVREPTATALAAALHNAYALPAATRRRIASSARDRAKEIFSIDAVAERTVSTIALAQRIRTAGHRRLPTEPARDL